MGRGSGGGDGLAQPHDRQRGEHVPRAAEETVDGGHVDAENPRGEVAAGRGPDDGHSIGCVWESDGRDDDVGDAVGLVEGRDGRAQRGEGGDLDV